MREHPEYIRVVKDCIAALPEPTFVVGAARDRYELAKASLQSLLSKPDHAKAAVEAYYAQADKGLDPENCERFARWLEQQGVDLSRWGE